MATEASPPMATPFLVASKPHLSEASALLLSEDTTDLLATTDLSATTDHLSATATRMNALQVTRDAVAVVTAMATTTTLIKAETMNVLQVTNVARAILAAETHIRATMSATLATRDALVTTADPLTETRTNALLVMTDANVAPSTELASLSALATITVPNRLPVTVDVPPNLPATPAAPVVMDTAAATMVDAAGDQSTLSKILIGSD